MKNFVLLLVLCVGFNCFGASSLKLPDNKGATLVKGSKSALKGKTPSKLQKESEPLSKKIDTANMSKAKNWNVSFFQSLAKRLFHHSAESRQFTVNQPVPDFAEFKYLLISSHFSFETKEFKSTIAKNLPSDMKLVVLALQGTETETLTTFSQWIPENRLIIISVPSIRTSFWARDAYPYPVYRNGSKDVGLVSAKYPYGFDNGLNITTKLFAPVNEENFYFVGGNLMADEFGTCFVITSERLFGVTDAILSESYGCKKVVRLPHVAGIGDVDEVVKVLPDGNILTNQDSYVEVLSSAGYKVTKLPVVDNDESKYRTYANSVLLGKKAFMPAYGQPSDLVAKTIYESFGYEVFLANSNEISTKGNGSFHCSTMAYPNINVDALAKMLHGTIFNVSSMNLDLKTSQVNHDQ